MKKRHKFVEIHLQLSPPFQRLLLSFWQLIIADIQRIELISVLTTSALSFGNGEVFFAIKLS